MRKFYWLGAAMLSAAAIPVQPALAQSDAKPALVQQFSDWGAYRGLAGGNKVCFAMAQPTSSQTNPPNRPRDPVFFYVTTRPAENVRNEINIIIGYPFGRNSETSLEIGAAKFSLQTQGDNAWARSSDEEQKILEAMRKGSDLTLRGQSARGTQTTDRFSLRGLGQALERAGQECR